MKAKFYDSLSPRYNPYDGKLPIPYIRPLHITWNGVGTAGTNTFFPTDNELETLWLVNLYYDVTQPLTAQAVPNQVPAAAYVYLYKQATITHEAAPLPMFARTTGVGSPAEVFVRTFMPFKLDLQKCYIQVLDWTGVNPGDGLQFYAEYLPMDMIPCELRTGC